MKVRKLDFAKVPSRLGQSSRHCPKDAAVPHAQTGLLNRSRVLPADSFAQFRFYSVAAPQNAFRRSTAQTRVSFMAPRRISH